MDILSNWKFICYGLKPLKISHIMDLSTENSFVKDKLLKISFVMDLDHWKFHLLWT